MGSKDIELDVIRLLRIYNQLSLWKLSEISINAISTGSGPHITGPTPYERGRRACSYGVGPVMWGPEPVSVALI